MKINISGMPMGTAVLNTGLLCSQMGDVFDSTTLVSSLWAA